MRTQMISLYYHNIIWKFRIVDIMRVGIGKITLYEL